MSEKRPHQVEPSPVQKTMIALMLVAWTSLFAWLVPELIGIWSPGREDTYSEWVFDLPLWAILSIGALHVVAGVLLIWSAGHFIEGYIARR